ncbi:MAG: D-alanine--D-alanine ligase, partial [Candidatus Omnitrophica bacterium]|nr:D-alanine--D-alanine ligase [Candidatus Omnitrophota bacterium]
KRKWKDLVTYQYPAQICPKIEKTIRASVISLYRAMRLRDLARFDFRVNPQGQFYFLEVNPLPGLSPESGDLVLLAQKKGWSYRKLILKIFHTALDRYPFLRTGT